MPEVIPALLKNIKVSRRGLTVTVSFQLTRLADVQLVAKLHGKAIARTAKKRLKAGKHTLELSFSAKRWPTRLSFKTKELDQAQARARDRAVKANPAPPVAAAARAERRRHLVRIELRSLLAAALPAQGRTRSPRACADDLQRASSLVASALSPGWRCLRCSVSLRGPSRRRRARARTRAEAIPSRSRCSARPTARPC